MYTAHFPFPTCTCTCPFCPSLLTPTLQKFTGCNFGITSKIPKSAFKIKSGAEHIKVHEADNGSGVVLHREFCNTCGSGLLEYGVRYSPSSSKTFISLPVCPVLKACRDIGQRLLTW